MSQHTTSVLRGDRPIFVSLGMIIVDELRFPSRNTLIDVPGGSGLYATFGARLFKAGHHALKVGCVVVAGYDFPMSVLTLLQSWEVALFVFRAADKPSTRGLLQYEDDAFGRKTFSYVTQPLQPLASQLETCNALHARSFHFLAPPEDLESQVSSLLHLRQEQGTTERPLIVWEPATLACDSVNLTSHLKACALVDVFSPNHLELGYLVDGKSKTEPKFSRSIVEAQARKFLEHGVGPYREGIVLIRSGEHGVLILSSSGQAEWLPAYYNKNSDKVTDPTGAGNAFLGAFTVAFQETNDPREASLRGLVAASYALEQSGPAELTACSRLSGELWNGSDVLSRLENYKARVSKL
ncbi:Ribokinase-like protein [Xylariaceae sp. FL1651]|nr:Ribokinase-like protein [Xylariaceae sp. FL1651]